MKKKKKQTAIKGSKINWFMLQCNAQIKNHISSCISWDITSLLQFFFTLHAKYWKIYNKKKSSGKATDWIFSSHSFNDEPRRSTSLNYTCSFTFLFVSKQSTITRLSSMRSLNKMIILCLYKVTRSRAGRPVGWKLVHHWTRTTGYAHMFM